MEVYKDGGGILFLIMFAFMFLVALTMLFKAIISRRGSWKGQVVGGLVGIILTSVAMPIVHKENLAIKNKEFIIVDGSILSYENRTEEDDEGSRTNYTDITFLSDDGEETTHILSGKKKFKENSNFTMYIIDYSKKVYRIVQH